MENHVYYCPYFGFYGFDKTFRILQVFFTCKILKKLVGNFYRRHFQGLDVVFETFFAIFFCKIKALKTSEVLFLKVPNKSLLVVKTESKIKKMEC